MNTSLKEYGIDHHHIVWNASPSQLISECADKELGKLTNTGALAIRTGKFTGRSPLDRFIVRDKVTEKEVWWGKLNIPFEPQKFDALYDKVTAYLSSREKLYARDVFVCSDPEYRLKIRAINEYPWSNLFVSNMFIDPQKGDLENFTPDWLIVNAPGFLADPNTDGTRASNFAILNFSRRIALIGGTGYTGEMKKGIFSALNFILPTQRDTLSMHCSANVGAAGDTAIFFGLSGTGKTTLSTDPQRKLIGDDEHGWSPGNKIFNFEGGCYAKVIGLSEEKEPDIYQAIKHGALLENVVFKDEKEVDYEDDSITENTRVSYPLSHISNLQKGSIGDQPKNIFFLTADAFGVLPPISKLSPGQAAYHFISGYTAKVAGTEEGVSEPTPSFSACFGAPFMLLHPAKYAGMLIQKMKENKVNVWMINTGWSGGGYGVGERIKLKYTRAMITAALEGKLDKVEFETFPIFNFSIPKSCPEIPSEILMPEKVWEDKDAYREKLKGLAASFIKNFEKFEAGSSQQILHGGPSL